jgi:hypothetical protein
LNKRGWKKEQNINKIVKTHGSIWKGKLTKTILFNSHDDDSTNETPRNYAQTERKRNVFS